MEEVPDDGGVIPPPARGFANVVVPIEEADPISVSIAPRQTDEFRTQPRDDDAQSALLVRQDVEQPLAAHFFAMRKLHSVR